MPDMIVVSDKLKLSSDVLKTLQFIETYYWDEIPNKPLFDYEIIVLDMNIKPRARVFGKGKNFILPLRLAEELRRAAFENVVIICLNYYNQQITSLNLIDGGEAFWVPPNSLEFSYQWLEAIERQYTDIWPEGIKLTEVRNARKIKNLSGLRIFDDYARGVKEYTTIIEGVEIEGTIMGYSVDKIYVTKNSNELVGCAVNYNKGSLIFLPQSSEEPLKVVRTLYDIGKHYYERAEWPKAEIKLPAWLERYKVDAEKALDRKIEPLLRKRQRFVDIDYLLYGYGEPLQIAVKKVFEELGLVFTPVERTKPIDLSGEEPEKKFELKIARAQVRKKKFAIEVQGSKDRIRMDSTKVIQAWSYIPFKEEHEKIVLAVNPFMELDPNDRNIEECFEPEVIKLLAFHGVCIIQTYDIYKLWEDLLRGYRKSADIIEAIYNTNGLFKYEPIAERSKTQHQ
jgi:hypothetical protein